MSGRRAGIALMPVVVAIVIIALLLSASHAVTVRTFALGAQNNGQVAVLQPGTQVCEGPVSGAESSNAVGIWGGGLGGPATITITAQDQGTGETLASGAVRALALENGWTAHLDRIIAAHRPVRICVREDTGAFTLSGAPAVSPNVVMSGRPGGREYSLVLLSQSQRSLLAWLPTAFSRASLWRPSWVGPWTFWVLAAALLATFGLAVLAVVNAAADDDDEGDNDIGYPSGPDGSVPDAPSPDEPSADKRSETREDRPQPVP